LTMLIANRRKITNQRNRVGRICNLQDAAVLPGRAAHRVTVLLRPGRVACEFLLRDQAPIRITQKRAPDEHEIGIATRNDIVGLPRLGDEADRAGHDVRVGPDAPRERHLITRTKHDLLAR
jgi:hypothetical protein